MDSPNDYHRGFLDGARWVLDWAQAGSEIDGLSETVDNLRSKAGLPIKLGDTTPLSAGNVPADD